MLTLLTHFTYQLTYSPDLSPTHVFSYLLTHFVSNLLAYIAIHIPQDSLIKLLTLLTHLLTYLHTSIIYPLPYLVFAHTLTKVIYLLAYCFHISAVIFSFYLPIYAPPELLTHSHSNYLLGYVLRYLTCVLVYFLPTYAPTFTLTVAVY